MSESFPGQNLIKKQISDSVADIFHDMEPNIVTFAVNKTIQCGLYEGFVQLRTNMYIQSDDISLDLQCLTFYNETMIQLMTNMANFLLKIYIWFSFHV